MAEYIEREALIGDLTAAMDHRGMGQVIGQTLIRYVKRQTAADVAPVVHGRWVEKDDGWGGTYYDCSACGESWTTVDGTPTQNNMKYCPNCGARMDGGDDRE